MKMDKAGGPFTSMKARRAKMMQNQFDRLKKHDEKRAEKPGDLKK